MNTKFERLNKTKNSLWFVKFRNTVTPLFNVGVPKLWQDRHCYKIENGPQYAGFNIQAYLCFRKGVFTSKRQKLEFKKPKKCPVSLSCRVSIEWSIKTMNNMRQLYRKSICVLHSLKIIQSLQFFSKTFKRTFKNFEFFLLIC